MAHEISIVDLPAQPVACINQLVPDHVVDQVGRTIHEVLEFLSEVRVESVGPAFARSTWEPGSNLQIGFPVSVPIDGNGRIVAGELPHGKVATTVHRGPRELITGTIAKFRQWIAEQGFREVGVPWETFLTNPREISDPENWMNGLFIPVEQVIAGARRHVNRL